MTKIMTKKRSKYCNKKIKIDNQFFDSTLEYTLYSHLDLLKKAHKIVDFIRQPKFLLPAKITYTADFIVYLNDDTSIIVDCKCKATVTQVYNLKKKLVKEFCNREIKEFYDHDLKRVCDFFNIK